VVGFGSDIAIGAEGEASCCGDQKLLPHLINVLVEKEGLGFCRLLHSKSKRAETAVTKFNYG